MLLPEIIVAMDVPDRDAFREAIKRLPTSCRWVKIGLELFCAEGPSILEETAESNRNIFLDLKLHDIPRTVSRALQSIGKLPVSMVTLHASGGEAMMRAAAEAVAGSDVRLLAVTVLTSLDQEDLRCQGVTRPVADQVQQLAGMAQASGIHGVVSSPNEASRLRSQCGPGFLIVTPGIRPARAETGDQKRVTTPRDAALAGASHLVIGRPILEAPDPEKAFLDIHRELEEAVREN